MARRANTLAIVLLAAAVSSGAAVGTPSVSAGRGTATLSVTALRVDADGVGDVGVIVTEGRATLDHDRAGVSDDGSSAQVAAVSARLDDGTALQLPDPPVRSEATRGRNVESKADASVTTPPVGGATEEGGIAKGQLLPARVESWRDDAGTGAIATSEIGEIDILSGLSRVEGAGPGHHESWSQGDQAGASARALTIRSATLLSVGPTLERLGVDPAELEPSVLVEVARALGLADEVAALGLVGGDVVGVAAPIRDQLVQVVVGAPLLAIADVSGSAQAVASVGPDGHVQTAAQATGSVGSIVVGHVELGGFDASGTAADWNALEEAVAEAVNTVLSPVDPRYQGLVRIRVMPLVVAQTRLDHGYAVADAEIRLLDVTVAIPPAPALESEPNLGIPDGVREELPGGGALPGLPLGRGDPGEAIRLELGSMAASAEHTRPGVAPRCDAVCATDGSTTNRAWDPARGFDAPVPGGEGPANGALPNTGGSVALVEWAGMAVLLGGALVRHGGRHRFWRAGWERRGDHGC